MASRKTFTECGIFGPDVDVALRGTAGDGCDRHAFDQAEGIAFHQHAVGEGAAVALVGVAGDVLFWSALRIVNRLPLDAGREAGAAAAAKARGRDLGYDVDRLHLQGFREPFKAAVLAIVLDRQRIGDAAARERQPFLVFEIGDLFGQSVTELVRLALKETGIEKFCHVPSRYGAVSDAALGRFDLDERFEIKHAARAVAHDRERRDFAFWLPLRSRLQPRRRRRRALQRRAERIP